MRTEPLTSTGDPCRSSVLAPTSSRGTDPTPDSKQAADRLFVGQGHDEPRSTSGQPFGEYGRAVTWRTPADIVRGVDQSDRAVGPQSTVHRVSDRKGGVVELFRVRIHVGRDQVGYLLGAERVAA